jgi:hypothetical protein
MVSSWLQNLLPLPLPAANDFVGSALALPAVAPPADGETVESAADVGPPAVVVVLPVGPLVEAVLVELEQPATSAPAITAPTPAASSRCAFDVLTHLS